MGSENVAYSMVKQEENLDRVGAGDHVRISIADDTVLVKEEEGGIAGEQPANVQPETWEGTTTLDGAHDVARGREAQVESLAEAKARRLAAPTLVRRMHNKSVRSSGREKYGIDRNSWNLGIYHRSKLRFLLGTLMQQHKWHQACGVLGVLLSIPPSPNAMERCRSDFAAAMEVLRRVGGVQSNDIKFRRMFRILNRHQPNARARGRVQMELALYLISVGDREAAYNELRPTVDGSSYREDPVLNLCHGLNSYCLWYEKALEEVSKFEAKLDIGSQVEKQKLEPMEEGTGENEAPEEAGDHGIHSDGSPRGIFLYAGSQKWEDGTQHGQENTARHELDAMNMEGDAKLWQASQKSIYEETDEQGFVQIGKEFWSNVKVPASEELDERLFPVHVPRELELGHYMVPMDDGRTRDLHAAAVKHLKQALASAPDMLPALLPLVQLLLAVHDIKGAVDEIDKCSGALNKHFIPPSLKVVLLESLDQKDPIQLASCHQEILRTNPLSLSSLKSLVNLHASGNLQTELLLECICLHLDVDPGAVGTWETLVSCLLEVEKKLQELSGTAQTKLMEENYKEDIEEQLSRDYVRRLWSGRYRWWLKKHFSGKSALMESQHGDRWLLAYKAACAAHIYGPGVTFVEQACNVLQIQQDNAMLKVVKHHCERSLMLFVEQI